jgi:hypothetical protein
MKTTAATFDITSIETNDASFLHLKHPGTEEPLFIGAGDDKQPVGISFHAPGTPGYEAASSKRTNRSLVRSKRKIDLNADLLRADTVDFLADVTVSFDHLGYPPAGELTGRDLFKALYGDRKFGWVIEQVNGHLADWASFTKGSATT